MNTYYSIRMGTKEPKVHIITFDPNTQETLFKMEGESDLSFRHLDCKSEDSIKKTFYLSGFIVYPEDPQPTLGIE